MNEHIEDLSGIYAPYGAGEIEHIPLFVSDYQHAAMKADEAGELDGNRAHRRATMARIRREARP